MAKRKRDSAGRFVATQIARLVSERPDLPVGVVEVANPPFDWKKTAKKALVPAAVVLIVSLVPTSEALANLTGLSPTIALAIWLAVSNYGKQHGWWGKAK